MKIIKGIKVEINRRDLRNIKEKIGKEKFEKDYKTFFDGILKEVDEKHSGDMYMAEYIFGYDETK